MGAEMLIKPAIDPEGLYEVCKSIAPTRALENQAYFISMNMTGEYLGSYAYGHSMVAGPDGRVLYEAGTNPVSLTMTFDLDVVSDARKYGTYYSDQYMRQLPFFNPPMPYVGRLEEAPIYKDLPKLDMNYESRAALFKRNGLMTINKK
jgi:hypothetical protein